MITMDQTKFKSYSQIPDMCFLLNKIASDVLHALKPNGGVFHKKHSTWKIHSSGKHPTIWSTQYISLLIWFPYIIIFGSDLYYCIAHRWLTLRMVEYLQNNSYIVSNLSVPSTSAFQKIPENSVAGLVTTQMVVKTKGRLHQQKSLMGWLDGQNLLMNVGVEPNIGGFPQNGWWKSWKTLWTNGWFGGTTIFGNEGDQTDAATLPPTNMFVLKNGAWEMILSFWVFGLLSRAICSF